MNFSCNSDQRHQQNVGRRPLGITNLLLFCMVSCLIGTTPLNAASQQLSDPGTQALGQKRTRFSPVPPLQQKTYTVANTNQSLGNNGAHNDQEANLKLAAAKARMILQGSNGQNTQHSGLSQAQPSSLVPSPRTHTSQLRSNNYRLANLTYEEFENKLIKIWGNRISGQAIDGDRTLRISLPATKTSAAKSMIFDRMTRGLTFEGNPRHLSAWTRTMEYVDQRDGLPGGNVCRLVDMNMAEPDLVQQVAFNLNQQEAAPKQDDVRREIQLPPGTDRLQLPGIVRQDEQDAGILNKVRIEVIPESGVIVLVGEDEDVARVEKLIKEIIEVTDTAKPGFEKIPLINQKSETIAESIQDIYNENFAEQIGPATVTAFATPNSLFVVGTPNSIEIVREIIRTLDVESDIDKAPEFKNYRLRYISAIDAKQRIDEYFGQATQNTLVDPPAPSPVYTVADYRSNTLIVKASEQLMAQVDLLIKDLDVDESGAANVVKIFPIRNVLAQDLQIVLQDAINGQLQNQGTGFNPDQAAQQQNQQNQGQQQNSVNQSQLRSAALELMTIDRNGDKINGGIMFDVRITTSANDNSLVVTGPGKAMPLIEELIVQLDRVPDAETLIKVFTVINGDAQALLDMLQTLFGADQQQGGGANQAGQSLTTLPLQSLSAADGNSLVNLRFGVDNRTNSIIASGPEGDLRVVEDLLIRLDEDDIADRRVSVYRLSNAPVLDVSDAINAWLEERAAQTDAVVNNVLTERRDVILVPEVISNSLIVSARPEYYYQVESIIRALDRRPPMVKVKVMIAQVDLNYLEEFGVQWGLQDKLLWTPGGELSNGVGTSFVGENGISAVSPRLVPQILGNVGLAKTSAEAGYGGLVVSAGNQSVELLLRALKNKNCSRVLARPHIMTLENLTGRVQIGSRVPYQTGQTIANNGSTTNNIEFQDVGIILEITPRVTPDGMIVMYVNATSSKLGSLADGANGGATEGGAATFEQRPIDTTTALTAIMAKSGQTVVFSGLLQESKEKIDRGIPILGDLPYVGPLFKYQTDKSDRKELMIVMTPYLVDSDEDIEMANQDEVNRMHWCYCDVAELYGDLSYGDQGFVTDTTKVFYPDSDPTGGNPQFVQGGSMGNQTIPNITGESGHGLQAGTLKPISSSSPSRNAHNPNTQLPNNVFRGQPMNPNPAQAKPPKRDSSKPLGTYFGHSSNRNNTN